LNISSAIKILIYHSIIIVNKTERDIFISVDKVEQKIEARKNEYLWDTSNSKVVISIKFEGNTYKSSLTDIHTIGLSGHVNLEHLE